MTQKRSKEPVDLSDVLCLTQPLTSVENVHDVFKGAVVKTGSSRSAVDGKKNSLKLNYSPRFIEHH